MAHIYIPQGEGFLPSWIGLLKGQGGRWEYEKRFIKEGEGEGVIKEEGC